MVPNAGRTPMFVCEPRLDQTPDETQPQLALPCGFEREAMKANQFAVDFILLFPRAPADGESADWVLRELKRHGLSRTRADNTKEERSNYSAIRAP